MRVKPPLWLVGGHSGRGSGCGPLLVRDFFYSPSSGEIPCQTRALPSLFPIPPPSLLCSPSTALKNMAFASLGKFVRSSLRLTHVSFNPCCGSLADTQGADRGAGRCWSGISSFPSYGEIPCQTRALPSLFPIPPLSLPCSPSTALKGMAFASLGHFCRLAASLGLAF